MFVSRGPSTIIGQLIAVVNAVGLARSDETTSFGTIAECVKQQVRKADLKKIENTGSLQDIELQAVRRLLMQSNAGVNVSHLPPYRQGEVFYIGMTDFLLSGYATERPSDELMLIPETVRQSCT